MSETEQREAGYDWGNSRSGARPDGTPRELRSRLRAFLGRYLHESTLADGDDLFASGRVNSLFAMQLVLFLEKEFRVRIENRDLDLANFRSIDAMAALIEKKLAVLGPAPDSAARPEREN